MTILTLNRKELEKKVGKITKEIEKKITMMGTPVESVSEKEINIEIFPNRPDLLSFQNFSRALRQYLGKEGPANFKVHEAEKDYVIKVEKSVKSVRPHTACAIVKNLNLDDEKIKEIIDMQEKLHLTIGRKRKKVAIGIYPLEKIKLPIRFTAKSPDEIKFLPLESEKEMTGRQILKQHSAGREYAHLLEGSSVFPIFIDSEDKILSMPPIINSYDTGKITKKTKDIFIECSGSNLEYLKKTLNIIVASFAEMGGKIYSMTITGEDKFISPNMEPEKLEFKIKEINQTLGLEISEKDIKSHLEKMRIGFEKKKEKTYALIPAYRTDILHWIDLTEEIAIAYGYENFEPEIPKISTLAEEDIKARRKKTVAEILSGLGLIETPSFHLTTKQDIKKIYYNFKDFIEVCDSKTEYNTLRTDLLSNLLKILSENSSSIYPQKIFELGKIFEIDKTNKEETGIIEKENLSVVLIDEKMTFTDIKQVLDYFFKMLDKEYEIKETSHQAFIEGRAGEIIIKTNKQTKQSIGYIGEISPRVLKNFKLNMPVGALEINLDWLF